MCDFNIKPRLKKINLFHRKIKAKILLKRESPNILVVRIPWMSQIPQKLFIIIILIYLLPIFNSFWTNNCFDKITTTKQTPFVSFQNLWKIELKIRGTMWWAIWQYGLWSFQNSKDFCPRINISRGSHWIELWVNGELSNCAKIWLSKLIFYVKNHLNLSQFFFFFSFKNTNLRAHFLLLTFLHKINF